MNNTQPCTQGPVSRACANVKTETNTDPDTSDAQSASDINMSAGTDTVKDPSSVKSTNNSENPDGHHQTKHTKVCFNGNECVRSADNIPFDSDAVLVFLDSCVTDGITPSISDFEHGTYKQVKEPSGFVGSGGPGAILGYGTVIYSIVSDDGELYNMRIPNMGYSPEVPHRLLAPQYVKKDRENGTGKQP